MQETIESAAGAHSHEINGAGSGAAPFYDSSIGRIVSVTGSKAIVLLDNMSGGRQVNMADRPEMGTLLAIPQQKQIPMARHGSQEVIFGYEGQPMKMMMQLVYNTNHI